MKERTNKDTKREKLLKIGLTETDIQQLFFIERMAARQGQKEAAADKAAAPRLVHLRGGNRVLQRAPRHNRHHCQPQRA